MDKQGGNWVSIGRLFVYGSLSKGMVQFEKIKDYIVGVNSAKVNAIAYRLQIGFPALLEPSPEQEVLIEGQILDLQNLEALWSLLDQFHGVNSLDLKQGLYFRKEVSVFEEKEGDFSLNSMAWIYFLNPEKLPLQSVLIENGDWKKSLHENPSIIELLTDRQKQYLKKLGTSNGKEGVSTDLGLYRELIKMELIVDKGRRLALSKLGIEVFRYL